jgi:hypothetical protein
MSTLSLSTTTQVFQEKIAAQPETSLSKPALCWETPESWAQALQRLTTIEFGNRFYGTPHEVVTYEASAQPVFNQNLTLLAENLCENQAGLDNIITAESAKQFDRFVSTLDSVVDRVDTDAIVDWPTTDDRVE